MAGTKFYFYKRQYLRDTPQNHFDNKCAGHAATLHWLTQIPSAHPAPPKQIAATACR
ncbi:hypothetical protein GCM10023156_46660 [Novipirellula rosea]|uniref:Uncharacterized protein n=1 Tax=Novipirellula rosea TaxID=1031540 RepID=A0ABP8NAA2_9BACT